MHLTESFGNTSVSKAFWFSVTIESKLSQLIFPSWRWKIYFKNVLTVHFPWKKRLLECCLPVFGELVSSETCPVIFRACQWGALFCVFVGVSVGDLSSGEKQSILDFSSCSSLSLVFRRFPTSISNACFSNSAFSFQATFSFSKEAFTFILCFFDA